jgi:dolichyl-phosphate-mannose-protein mannosyltransferase
MTFSTVNNNTEYQPEFPGPVPEYPEPLYSEPEPVPVYSEPVPVYHTRWYRIIHWEYLPLFIIVIATLVFHFLSINKPQEIVWDEVHYVPDARSIINDRIDLRQEHPALAKLFIVAGIKAFGDNAFGWRFFSVVFGTIGIFLFYFICKKLNLSWKARVFATFLFALDNMGFLHAGLALLDVYQVTFLLAGFLLYLHGRYPETGVAFALSACCKLAGFLGLAAVALHWLIFRRDKWKSAIGTIFVTAIAFVGFTVLFEYIITGTLVNPYTRLHDMFVLTSINKFTIPPLSISSRPWTWIYPDWIQPGWTNFILYCSDPQYVSFISFTIQMLIVPVIGYMLYKAVKGSDAARLVLLWFVATYLFWMTDAFTNRVTFVFYFLPTTPAICIGLGIAISDIIGLQQNRKAMLGRWTNGIKATYAVISLYLLFHLAIFIVFNPAIPPIIKTWLPPWT